MARTAKDANKLAKAAAKAKGLSMCAMCMRFWPGWAWLKDAVNDGLIAQKVLAEAFAGDMVHGVDRWMRSMAVSMAAARLPGSALPVPASSSAVPWSTEVRMIGKPSVMLTALPKPMCFSTGSP